MHRTTSSTRTLNIVTSYPASNIPDCINICRIVCDAVRLLTTCCVTTSVHCTEGCVWSLSCLPSLYTLSLPMGTQLNGFVDKYFEMLSAVVTSAPLTTAQPHSQPDNNKTSDSLPTAFSLRHQQEQQSRSSPLVLIEAFISSLTNKDENGRVSVALTGDLHSSSLRFFLLNPAVHFAEVVQECRAVIVAGGTMQPVSAACN